MKCLMIAFCGLALAGCSGDHEDLRQWMQENTRDMKPNIPKLPSVQPYEPVPYEVTDILDPLDRKSVV